MRIAESLAARQRRDAKRAAAGVIAKPPAILCRCVDPDGVLERRCRVVVCRRCALVLAPERG